MNQVCSCRQLCYIWYWLLHLVPAVTFGTRNDWVKIRMCVEHSYPWVCCMCRRCWDLTTAQPRKLASSLCCVHLIEVHSLTAKKQVQELTFSNHYLHYAHSSSKDLFASNFHYNWGLSVLGCVISGLSELGFIIFQFTLALTEVYR